MTHPDSEPAPAAARPSFFVVFLIIACIALVAIDFGLLRRVRHLKQRVAQLTLLAEQAPRPILSEGDRFPTITLLDERGEPVALEHQTGPNPTLLLISSPTCDACDEVRDVWDRAVLAADESNLPVVGLLLGATPDALLDRTEPYPLLVAGGDSWSLVQKIPGIPAAVLIDATGVVARAFYGVEQAGLPGAVLELAMSP